MNIHEHQAKEILKEFGAPVSRGVVILSINNIKQEIKKLEGKEFCFKSTNSRWRKRKSGWREVDKKG